MSLKKPVIFYAFKGYYWCTVKRLGKSFNRQPIRLYTISDHRSRPIIYNFAENPQFFIAIDNSPTCADVFFKYNSWVSFMPNIRKRNFKYLDIITGIFVAVLLISDISDTKAITVGFLSFGGGTFLFPVAYIFGDILTEVYGFKRARRVVWIGFACEALMAIMFALVAIAPASPDYPYQKDFMHILGLTPRIAIASLTAYFFGEFINSVVLAKMKIMTRGRFLWTRTIGSTIIAELVDTSIFMFIAFFGVFPLPLILSIIVSGYFLKVIMEVLFTPITYWVVNFLKRKEHEDYYDLKTKFTPFEFNVE